MGVYDSAQFRALLAQALDNPSDNILKLNSFTFKKEISSSYSNVAKVGNGLVTGDGLTKKYFTEGESFGKVTSYGGIGDTSDETNVIKKIIALAGPGATIKFNPNKVLTLRGRLIPVTGQEWIDLNLKQADQFCTATMTIATPCVVTIPSTARVPLKGEALTFTTTGALPTGLTANTTYFATNISGQTIQLATTKALALAGTSIATSGTQSGTHTLSQGMSALTASVLNTATSCTVANSKIFNVGDSVLLVDTITSSVPTKFSHTNLTITKIVTATDTIYFDRAVNTVLASDDSATTLASGYLILGGPLIGNRFEVAELKGIPSNFRLTRASLEGNRINNTLGQFWACQQELDIIGNDCEFFKLKIRNARTEGVMLGGSNNTFYSLDIDTCTGNGIHYGVSVAGSTLLTCYNTIVEGGTIRNCNDALPYAGYISTDRFASQKNTGHRGGGMTLSNLVDTLTIRAVTVDNCFGGVGEIDGNDNNNVTIDGCTFIHNGTATYGGGNYGAIDVSNIFSGGNMGGPQNIVITNNTFIENYPSRFGRNGYGTGKKTSIIMDNNNFIDSCILCQYVTLTHTSGNYIFGTDFNNWNYSNNPIISDGSVCIQEGVDGLFNANISGGYCGLLINYGNNSPSAYLELNVNLIDNYQFGLRNKAGIDIGEVFLNKVNITTTVGNYFGGGNNSSSYVGLCLGSGGGFGLGLSQLTTGSLVINVGAACYAGFECEPTAVAVMNGDFPNAIVKCQSTGATVVNNSNVRNLTFNNLGYSPSLSTVGWDTSVTAVGAHLVN